MGELHSRETETGDVVKRYNSRLDVGGRKELGRRGMIGGGIVFRSCAPFRHRVDPV